MHYYVTLTLNCNQKCRYCYEKCVDDIGEPFPFDVEEFLPTTIQYPLNLLAQFLEKDPESTVIFYGGEPTLAMNEMRWIMDNVHAEAFLIQTNGLLIDRLEPGYLTRLNTILVSVDGDQYLTDYYRGQGTFKKVVQNLKLIRERGFRGELIARMTVGAETRLDEAVRWLLNNDEFPFQSVHWQLDAQFWRRDYKPRIIQEWFRRYNEEVSRLVRYWLTEMERNSKVLRLYPFIGVMESLLRNDSTRLRCGAGWTEFNIQTDGNITPCPVMAGMKTFYQGNIGRTDPRQLRDSVSPGEPCTQCTILQICGGRCLYANATKLWGAEGYSLVCQTVVHLIETLSGSLPRVRKLIDEGVLAACDFDYVKYNSCEIIP